MILGLRYFSFKIYLRFNICVSITGLRLGVGFIHLYGQSNTGVGYCMCHSLEHYNVVSLLRHILCQQSFDQRKEGKT